MIEDRAAHSSAAAASCAVASSSTEPAGRGGGSNNNAATTAAEATQAARIRCATVTATSAAEAARAAHPEGRGTAAAETAIRRQICASVRSTAVEIGRTRTNATTAERRAGRANAADGLVADECRVCDRQCALIEDRTAHPRRAAGTVAAARYAPAQRQELQA